MYDEVPKTVMQTNLFVVDNHLDALILQAARGQISNCARRRSESR